MDASRKIMDSQRVTCWRNCSHGWYLDAIPATEQQAHCAKTRCVGRPNILEKGNSSTMVHHGPSWWICPRDFNELIRIAVVRNIQHNTTHFEFVVDHYGSLFSWLLSSSSLQVLGLEVWGLEALLWHAVSHGWLEYPLNEEFMRPGIAWMQYWAVVYLWCISKITVLKCFGQAKVQRSECSCAANPKNTHRMTSQFMSNKHVRIWSMYQQIVNIFTTERSSCLALEFGPYEGCLVSSFLRQEQGAFPVTPERRGKFQNRPKYGTSWPARSDLIEFGHVIVCPSQMLQ